MDIFRGRKIRYSDGAKQPNGQICCCYFSGTTEKFCASTASSTFWKICKDYILLLKSDKENGCKVIMPLINRNETGMKTPS